MQSYKPLNEAEAVAYTRQLPIFDSGATLTCNEIGDGNLNLVFHIQDIPSNRSIIVKQALPYAKVVGESWPLTLDRARIESEALRIQAKYCPAFVPVVHHYDETLALTVMEDLSNHIIMRAGLIQGNDYPQFAAHIAQFMAHTLFFTSDLGMNQQEKKLLQRSFINPELCKITEDLIFDDPYHDCSNNSFDANIQDSVNAIWQDEQLHNEVAILRQRFLTEGQALLHGDLHTGSIFVTPDSTKVIDPEFAYYGPMGFDIGNLLANLWMNMMSQAHWSEPSDVRHKQQTLLAMTESIWQSFTDELHKLWKQHCVDRMMSTAHFESYYMHRLLQDTIGFAGCEIIRRIIGLAHVADIDTIPVPEAKAAVQRASLQLAANLIKQHRQLNSFEEAIAIVKQGM